MGKYNSHIFVCSNTRPPFAKESCGAKKSHNILAAIKTEIEARNLKGVARACGSSCLGPCEVGPVIVIYPEAIWYENVTLEDVPEIVESHIVNGKPVERLIYHWPKEQ